MVVIYIDSKSLANEHPVRTLDSELSQLHRICKDVVFISFVKSNSQNNSNRLSAPSINHFCN